LILLDEILQVVMAIIILLVIIFLQDLVKLNKELAAMIEDHELRIHNLEFESENEIP
jgi:hypothetical protein